MPAIIARAPGISRTVTSRVVQERAEKMLAKLGQRTAELSVLLTDDKGIHAFNLDYRKKDKPTDVLAFAQEEGLAMGNGKGPRLLGDVIISIPTAARQAKERKRRTIDEVTFLLGHGLLHLLGWDHRTDEEERKMNAKTEVLVRAATDEGVAPKSAPKTGIVRAIPRTKRR
jgi:probable rRNA maturation factor